MNLMLAATLAWVTLGLFVPHFGRREQMLTYGLAVVITAMYFLSPARYM